MSGLSLAWVDDEAALAGIEADWWRLWQTAPSATPFQSPAWLLPWWAHFRPGRLATLAVRDGGLLMGLFPAYVEQAAEGARLLPLGIGNTDRLDILVAGPRADEVLAAIARAVAALRLPVLLTDLGPTATARRLPVPAGFRTASGPGEVCPAVALAGASMLPEGCPDAVPAPQRRKLRMAGHRVERRGGLRAEDAAALGPDTLLDLLETLHTQRWRTRGERGVLADPSVRAFHRAALPRLLAAGLADAEVLFIEDRPAAAYYGLQDPRASYAYLGGFDEAFERESPGALALGRAMARAVSRGAARFDFLRGGEGYKYAWGGIDEPLGWRSFHPEA